MKKLSNMLKNHIYVLKLLNNSTPKYQKESFLGESKIFGQQKIKFYTNLLCLNTRNEVKSVNKYLTLLFFSW